MESHYRLGIYPTTPPDIYPKYLTSIEEPGDFLKNLKEDKNRILSRAQSDEDNIRIQFGILCMLLSDRNQSLFEFKDLILISRDNLKLCSAQISTLIQDYWTKLTLQVRTNIVHLIGELLVYPIGDSLFYSIIKRMITGDLSQSNLVLVENVLTLIQEHKDMILRERKSAGLIAYTYMRLIPTHYQCSIGSNTPSNNLARLCKKEIELVMDILRNNFDDCFKLGGRDLLFVMLQVCNIPEFAKLWSDMTKKITSLSKIFKDYTEIFSIITHKNYIQTAISFEMELWIIWLMRNVHHCSSSPYKRYQEMFLKKFFITPESSNIRPYLIRFIVRAFYPDNEMIGSTLLSRWATISWLIIHGTVPSIVSCLSKLALVYDWFFYERSYDCIMDIEPAILVIMHNLNKYSHLSLTIIDFMTRTACNLIPARQKMVNGIKGGFIEAMRVSVFRNITPLVDVLKHHHELYKQFSELLNEPSLIPLPPGSNIGVPNIATNVNINNGYNSMVGNSANMIIGAQKTNDSSNISDSKNGISKLSQGPAMPKDKIMEQQLQFIKSPIQQVKLVGSIPNPSSALSVNLFDTSNSPIGTKLMPSSLMTDENINDVLNVAAAIPTIQMEETVQEDIDDIHRKFMKYSLIFDYEVERIDVKETIDQISSNVTVALQNLYNAFLLSPYANEGKLMKKKRYAKKLSTKKIDINDDDLSDEECVQELCEKMERVVIAILGDDDSFDDLTATGKTAAVICEICYPYFEKKLYPGNPYDEEKLKSSLTFHPIFVVIKSICNMSPNDNKREVLLLLLSEMQMRQPRIGYYLLYYLKVAKIKDSELSIYRNLCNSLEKPNLKNSLYKDLELLCNDDSKLMVFLIPELYKAFSAEMVNNSKFAHLIISTIDANEISLLVSEIHKNKLLMFDSSSIVEVLKTSLEWGTIEQYFLWELLIAHSFLTKHYYGIIPYLKAKNHPEAMTKLSNLLKQDKVSIELTKILLNREVHDNDHFTCTLLQYWAIKTKTKFTEVLHSIMSASLGHRDRKKKHTGNLDEISVDLIKILEHLDFMRKYCEDISFLEEELMQIDLKHVLESRNLCDQVKSRFTELLAFVEEDNQAFQVTIDEASLMHPCTTMKGRSLRHTDSRANRSMHSNTGSNIVGALAGTKRLYNMTRSSDSDDDDDDNRDDDDVVMRGDDEDNDEFEDEDDRKHTRAKRSNTSSNLHQSRAKRMNLE